MGNLFKTLLCALPLVMLGACSSDEPNAPGGGVAQKSETRYLKVNLVNAGGDPGSRAPIGDNTGDYTDGTQAENKIRTVDFYLYKTDKTYHSHVPMSLTAPEDPKTQDVTNPSVHGFYEANVPISLVQGEEMPAYVICIINAVQSTWYENRSMADAQRRLLSSLYSPEKGLNGEENVYIGMSNSVYYGTDEVTGESNTLIMATPFDTDKLLTMTQLEEMSPEEIKDVTIDIYVERYAAKVNFSLAAGAVDPYVTSNNVSLTFTPEKWGLNAYEKEYYFLKSYRHDDTEAAAFEEFGTMDGLLFAGWNRDDHFRSFWARTPGYFKDNYPLVADDILDLNITDENNYPFGVHYLSYTSTAGTVGTPEYVMESTMKGTRLTGQGMPEQYLPLTSIPSVVLVGQYKINDEAKTFYTYQKGDDGKPELFCEAEGDIDGVQTIEDRLLSTQSTVLLKDSEGKYRPVRKSDMATANIFAVKHPVMAVRNGIKVGGDVVTLQVDGDDYETLKDFYYYDSDASDFVAINTADRVTKVNRLLYQNIGGAHAYIDGKAFFSAPIQHWGWYRDGNDNKDLTIDKWDWSQMKTGDFGIVRNHVYTIEVGKITGLGTGIIDVNDPLLPPTDKVSYAVRFRVNIQKWATLPKQVWNWN